MIKEIWLETAGMLSPMDWALFLLSAFLVGTSKAGVKGMGMLIVPLMAWVFGGKPSTGIVLPLLIMADVFAVSYYNRHAEWKYIWRLLPAAAIGVIIGVWLGRYMDGAIFTKVLAGIILGSLVLMLIIDRAGVSTERLQSWTATSIFGLLGGITTMIGNAAGPIMAVYLLATRIPKYAFIGTGAWFFMMINWFKVPFHIWVWETITPASILLCLSSLPAIGLGILVGIRIVRFIPEKAFRYFVLIMTGIIAIRLLIR